MSLDLRPSLVSHVVGLIWRTALLDCQLCPRAKHFASDRKVAMCSLNVCSAESVVRACKAPKWFQGSKVLSPTCYRLVPKSLRDSRCSRVHVLVRWFVCA